MNLLDAHGTALEVFDTVAHRIQHDRFGDPSPCTEWSVRDVLNHLTNEQLWVPHLLRGETMAEVGDRYEGDVLGTDPLRSWETAAAAARAAWLEPGAVDREVALSFGLSPASLYLEQMTADLTVHAWDIAAALGIESGIPDALAEQVEAALRPQIDDWRGAIFDEEVPVADQADPTTRLIGLTGRNPAWPSGQSDSGI